MDFDAAGLHQHDTLIDIHEQVRLRPRGQLDLFLENGVRFLEGLPLGNGIATGDGGLGRAADFAECDREEDCDEEPSVTQLRK